jgi:hypothetical protein
MQGGRILMFLTRDLGSFPGKWQQSGTILRIAGSASEHTRPTKSNDGKRLVRFMNGH